MECHHSHWLMMTSSPWFNWFRLKPYLSVFFFDPWGEGDFFYRNMFFQFWMNSNFLPDQWSVIEYNNFSPGVWSPRPSHMLMYDCRCVVIDNYAVEKWIEALLKKGMLYVPTCMGLDAKVGFLGVFFATPFLCYVWNFFAFFPPAFDIYALLHHLKSKIFNWHKIDFVYEVRGHDDWPLDFFWFSFWSLIFGEWQGGKQTLCFSNILQYSEIV